MIGRLMVPVTGTIAALVVILLTHKERDHAETTTTGDLPPFDFPDAPEHMPPPPEEETPEGHHLRLELRADGTLVDPDDPEMRFKSVEDLLTLVAGAGHSVSLSKGAGTTDAALDEAVRKIGDSRTSDGRTRFEVSKEAAPEPQTSHIEMSADGTLRDVDRGTAFASADELGTKLGAGPHTLVVTNAAGVTAAQLDALVAKLREAKLPNGEPRFEIRKVYRAPEPPAGDGR